MKRWLLPSALVLLLVPLATGQGEEDFVDVEVTIDPREAVMEGADSEQTFTITVRNPTDNPFAGSVELSVSPAPDGWSFTLSEDTFELAGNEDASTTLRIDPGQAAAEDTFTITVSATITYDLTLTQQTASDSAAAQVVYTKGALAGLQDRFGDSLLWLALVGLLALVIIVIVATARGGGIVLTAPKHHITAPPGSVVEIPVTVYNKGRKDDRVTLGVGRLPRGWDAGLEEESVVVAGKRSKVTDLRVLMPKNAEGRVAVSVAAHSQAGAKATELHLTVEVEDRSRGKTD